jgi:acyl carrier protein
VSPPLIVNPTVRQDHWVVGNTDSANVGFPHPFPRTVIHTHVIFTARPMIGRIRTVIEEHARLTVDPASLDEHADLYEAGMTSHASVNLMLALEDAFDVEFPDAMLTRSVFQSIASIAAALTELEVPVA